MNAVRTKPETAPSGRDAETLHDQFFGRPVLNEVEDETDERDELEKYALVQKIAEENPRLAQKATRDGTRAHYRNAHPFDYPVTGSRASGEVDQ